MMHTICKYADNTENRFENHVFISVKESKILYTNISARANENQYIHLLIHFLSFFITLYPFV